MHLIRPAQPSDLGALADLARHLNTVNLPADRERLSSMLQDSQAQLDGSDAPDQAIIFVLENEHEELQGSATIIAKHGSPQAPHCFFDVIEEERYSARLEKVFHHQVLRLGASFVPRTEIGGLVLHPDMRGMGIGRFLSLSRFQFIANYRSHFCDYILAELLPAFDEDGNSPLWNALGHRFTGLTYREADRLSGQEKEFIEDLFPRTDVHVSLFAPRTQEVIGQVGKATKGALRLLLQEGFFYTKRIDPFDGGPHYRAATDDVASVKATRVAQAVEGHGDHPAMVGVKSKDPSNYKAVQTTMSIHGMHVHLSKEVFERLGVAPGADVLVTPL